MLIILILISLALSGLFSGSETAIITASRLRLQHLIKKKVKAAKFAYGFIADPEKSIITTLVGNNIMLVLYSSLAALYLQDFFTEYVIVIISSAFILIFGEIIPKSLFRERANKWVIPLAYLMNFFYYAFYPVNKIFRKVSRLLSKLSKSEQTEKQVLISRQTMGRFIKAGSEEGAIEEEKGEMLFKSFSVGNQPIKHVMRPRIEIVAIEESASINEALELFKSSGLSQLMVYKYIPDQIIGKIHVKDLLDFPDTIGQIIRKISIVPETKSAFELLREFRENKNNVAIVIDEYGSTSGIVTLEDIIEELFGEIDDEHDPERPLYKKLIGNNYLVNGRMEVDFANENLNLDLPEGDYETIAGLVTSELGHIPHEGEQIDINHWRFIVRKADRRRIRWLKISEIKLD